MSKEQREFTINFFREMNAAGIIGRQITGAQAQEVFRAAEVAWKKQASA